MPLYQGSLDNFQERVYQGKTTIRRIVRGKELVYGLYDLVYFDRSGKYYPNKDYNELSIYAWGKKRDLPTVNNNSYFNDYFESYQTHWFGWWDDYSYSTERLKNGSFEYYISKKEHHDFNLYAKWTQKQYEWSGTVNWVEYYWTGSDDDDDEDEDEDEEYSGPEAGDLISDWYSPLTTLGSGSAYPSTGYSTTCGCTSWVECRRYDISGGEINELPYYTRYLSHEQHDDPEPGDVALYGSPGSFHHMGFIEANGMESDTNATGTGEAYHVHTSTPGTYTSGFYGFFASGVVPGGGGGKKRVSVDKSHTFGWTEATDQDNPQEPDPDSLIQGYIEYDEYDSVSWSSGDPQKRTNIRSWAYLPTPQEGGDWGSWEQKFDDWELGWDWT